MRARWQVPLLIAAGPALIASVVLANDYLTAYEHKVAALAKRQRQDTFVDTRQRDVYRANVNACKLLCAPDAFEYGSFGSGFQVCHCKTAAVP